MNNNKVKVGSGNYRPWEKYSRESLEYSCIELGMSSGTLDQYTKEELFKKLISMGCAKSAMDEEGN